MIVTAIVVGSRATAAMVTAANPKTARRRQLAEFQDHSALSITLSFIQSRLELRANRNPTFSAAP
jgi:hypothetical protein